MKSNVVVKVTEGALLNPDEVRYQTDADLGWALAAIVDSHTIETIKAHKNQPVERRFTWWAPRSGGEFLLVTHQIDSLQHRFLVSGYDANTHTWVRGLRERKFCCMFTDDENGAPPHYVLRDRLEQKTLAAFEGIAQLTLPCTPHTHLEQMNWMLSVVANPAFVPSMKPCTEVKKVIVSPVHPEAIAPHIGIHVVGIT